MKTLSIRAMLVFTLILALVVVFFFAPFNFEYPVVNKGPLSQNDSPRKLGTTTNLMQAPIASDNFLVTPGCFLQKIAKDAQKKVFVVALACPT